MTNSNLPSTRIKDADARRKRPRPAGSNSRGEGSPEGILSKKGRKVAPLLPDKLQQTPPSTTVTRTERLNKRIPSPLERSMSSQEGPSPSSECQGASPSSKLQASKRTREEEEKKIKESRRNSIGSSRRKSAISAPAYMECFIEQRKNIKLASLEDLTSPQTSPVSNQNQDGGLTDTDNVSGHSKLDVPALSNEKEVAADLTCASDPEEDTSLPTEVSQFSDSGEGPSDANVCRQRDPEVKDDADSYSRCDSREPFEGNSINPTVEKNLTASGEPEIVACSEHGKCTNNGKGLAPGYINDAGGSEKLLLCNSCNRSCPQSSLSPRAADAAPGVLQCPACVGRKEDFSRFVEYWVPAQISNVQLEQYCEMLLSNSLALRSPSRSGPVGALRDILISIRKCCDHPYIVDTKLAKLLSKEVPATEYLDIGIKASGKLVLLDKLLHGLKKQKMRVLVLYQHIGGCSDTTGDILDDYMRQRFGEDSYERVDSGVIRSRVMAALNWFNQIEQGRFVFLLENRACHARIKLSSIDVVIIFDSDWNPINDLRNLQKLSLESELKQVKVFRLYSPFTVEEKVLVCAKQGATWDGKLLSVNYSISQMFLMWGASYLMKKLDEFHNISKISYISDSDKKLTENVVQEFLNLLESSGEETVKSSCIITKAQVGVVGYSTDDLLQGESSLQLESKESPHIFWSRLLNRKILRWKYITTSSQRDRKKVRLYDQFTTESGKARKKDQRKLIDKAIVFSPEKQGMPATKEGVMVSPCSSLPGKDHLLSTETRNVEQDERTQLIDAQRSLHVELKQEIMRLSEILELLDDVRVIVEIFFDYVINNHHLPREPTTILQAFQLALCWTSASLLKEKMDRKVSLELSQRHLSYSCSREEVDCVYMRLRDLKKMFLATLESSDSIDSSKAPELLARVAKLNHSSAKMSHLAAASRDVSAERAGATSGAACCSSEVLASHKVRDGKQLNGCLDNPRETVEMQPCVEMKRNGISRDFEAKKASLEKSYQLEIAIVRLHHTGSKLKEKLEMLKRERARKLKELELDHSTTENHFQRESQSFSVQGDRHSYERIAHPEENTEEIDSAPGKSTDQKTRISVQDIENGDSEISRASSSAQALASKSSTKVASLQDEENETADSGSTSGIAKGASKELQGGAGIKTNHQENAYSRDSCLGEVGLAKERTEEAMKDALPGVSVPLFSKENADSASDVLLMSRTSIVEVLVEEPVTVSNVMEGLPSEAVPPGISALPGVEALQYDQGRESPVGDCHTANNHTSAIFSAGDQNGDGSGRLLSDEPGRATTSNVPSTSRDEMMSPNLISDPREDLCHEVTSTRECLLNSAPGTFSDFSEEDWNGHIQEQHDNTQEREVEPSQPCNLTSSPMEERNRQPPEPLNLPQRPEASDSQNNISSENDGAQMEPVLREEISGDVSPSEGPPHIAPAGASENELLGDALLSRPMPTGSQGQCNPHLLPTQTSSLPISNSPSGALGSRGTPVGSTFGPNRHPVQPLIQHAPGMSFSSREADPLENEFEKIRKEVEHADQTFDELKLRLSFERDREIQEMLAQIRTKFEGKLKKAEAEHDLKKKELDLHMNRVFMNKMLAAAFRHKCLDIKSSTSQGGPRVSAGGVSPDLAQQFALSSLLARNFQRQASVPSSHGPPPPTSQGGAIPPPRSQSIPPAVLNSQYCAPAGPPTHHAPSHSPRAPSGRLLNPVSLSETLFVPNRTSPTMVGHTFPVEQTPAIAPHLQHPRPGGRPILRQPVQDLVNRHMNLTTNAASLPATRMTNQVLPLEAMASQVRNVVPRPSGSSTGVVCLSDED